MAATRRSARISGRTGTQKTVTPPGQTPCPPRSHKRKQRAGTEDGQATETKPPPKKRIRRDENGPPPSAAKLAGKEGGLKQDEPVNRLADPKITNIALLSPGTTTRVVASRDVESVVLPSVPSTCKMTTTTTTTTTQNLLREACDHLIQVDARMKPLIDKVECKLFSPAGLAEIVDPFESLASGIISQQVSGAAAKSIKKKFIDLFDTRDKGLAHGFPSPSKVAACSIERLRLAGLSQRKAEYVQGLAEKFASGELSAKVLHDAPYEEVLETLVAVRGLGKWSVEMFAVFGLKRMDVFSLGDLGVQRGCAAFVGRDVSKLKKGKGGKWKYMSEKEMVELSDRFAPYRSLFMWYMWQVESVDVSVME